MQIFSNKISEKTINVFRKHYEEYKDDKKVNDINSHGIDIRTRIFPNMEAWEEIKKICVEHFPSVTDQEIYANYQRQSMPTFMHVDEYGTNRSEPTWTIIIPMHTDTRLSVVIFKEIFNSNEDLKNFIKDFTYENSQKKSNISEKIPLQHTPFNYKKENDYLADYLDLDGVFYYKIGDYVLFDTNQLHVTNNFKIYPEYKYKDLIQIHIGKAGKNGYNPFYKKV
jgi:hypothetical protein